MILLLSLIVVAWGCHAGTEVLWWLVEDDDTVDWYGANTTVAALQADKGDLYARVHAFGNNTDTYLNFWMLAVDPQTQDVYVFPDEGTGTQFFSVPPINAWADLTGFADNAYSFMIELGNYENGQWVAYVTSETKSYTDLQQQGATATWEDNELLPPPGMEWQTSYAVPEPNSGVLLLLGGALLVLRRRRNGGRA